MRSMEMEMEKHVTVPIAVHQQPPCITALVSRPLYKCPIHPTNRSIMILVVMATDMVVTETISTGGYAGILARLSVN